MKSKADELAIINHPVISDDLTPFLINGLGPAYANIVGPIRTREIELHDFLFENELTLKGRILLLISAEVIRLRGIVVRALVILNTFPPHPILDTRVALNMDTAVIVL
ncbi:hypothetical protein ACS0TY_013995 [Phlomoides rotata]